MKSQLKGLLIASLMSTLFFSCKKNKSDDPTPQTPIEVGGGESENITRIVLYLSSGSEKDTVTFNDPKGNGTNVTIDSLILKNSSTYAVAVKIFDDTKKPIAVVSDEIQKEANFHRFHYLFTSVSGSPEISTTILDKDNHTPAKSLGLSFELKTGLNLGKGKFTMNLRHFAEGIIKTDNPTDGEQDILAEFPVRIK